MTCPEDHALKPGALTAPRRNNYYFGKLMDVLHFQLEQSYGNDKRWLLNRLTLGEGVLCGLRVEAGANNEICVCPGVAIDGAGHEIIVPAKVCLNPRILTDSCGKPAKTLTAGEVPMVSLCLAYRECGTDFAPVFVSDCNTREQCAAGTTVEGFRLLVLEGAPKIWDDAKICEALLGKAGETAPAGYEVVATIEVKGKPIALAASADGKRVLALNESSPPALQVIDVETNAVTVPVDVAGLPAKLKAPLGGVSVAPDGGVAFVTHNDGIVMVDLASPAPTIVGTIAGKALGKCAAASAGKFLYAIDPAAKKVDCIDVAKSTPTAPNIAATIDTGGGPLDLAVSPDNTWLYILDVNATKPVLARVKCADNALVTAPPSPSVDKTALTLAVRGATPNSEAYVAHKDAVQRLAESGPALADFAVKASAEDSAFTTDGERYHVLSSGSGGSELVIFRSANLKEEIGRVKVADQPGAVEVVPGSYRTFVASAGPAGEAAGAITVIDVPLHARRKRLCDELSGPCPKPPDDGCVTLATIELLADGKLGKIDNCSHRNVIYSNTVLLEMILCLAERIERCCAGASVPAAPVEPVEPSPSPTGPFQITEIEFLNGAGAIVGALSAFSDSPEFSRRSQVSAIRVVFNRNVDHATVTSAPTAARRKEASMLVEADTSTRFVPGMVVADGPTAAKFIVQQADVFPVAGYSVSLFGDSNAAAGRPAIAEKTTNRRLDGERKPTSPGLPSGDAGEGGTFKFKFAIVD